MKIGSETHKELFCQSFMTSHREYEPENLPWPQLDSVALERIQGIPFWQQALDTEREAGVMVSAFADTVGDSVLREAIALQGMEEERHSRLIRTVIERYDISMPERPPVELPSNIEQAFIGFGYGECIDSFLAFGLFGLVRPQGLFPEPLFEIFDAVLQEEARHIMFFVNWVAYLQISQGRGAILRTTDSLWHYGKAIRKLVGIVSDSDSEGDGFTATGASTFIDELTPEMFLSTCIKENQRRMSAFDSRLLQPRLLPGLAIAALRTIRLLPGQSHQSDVEHQASSVSSQANS